MSLFLFCFVFTKKQIQQKSIVVRTVFTPQNSFIDRDHGDFCKFILNTVSVVPECIIYFVSNCYSYFQPNNATDHVVGLVQTKVFEMHDFIEQQLALLNLELPHVSRAVALKILYSLVINGPATHGQLAGNIDMHRNDKPFSGTINELLRVHTIYVYGDDGQETRHAISGYTEPYIPRTEAVRKVEFARGSYTPLNRVTTKQNRYPPDTAVYGDVIIPPFPLPAANPPAAGMNVSPAAQAAAVLPN